jgi:fructokinase
LNHHLEKLEYAVALDIGGTKIEGVLFNGRYDEVRKERLYFKKDSATAVVTLPRKNVLDMIDSMITSLRQGHSISGIGISVPDIVYPEGKIGSNGKIYGLKNFGLATYLARKHKVRCIVKNDADCFALGEYYMGAGRGKKNIIGIIYGTGIGSGIIIDGKLYSGSHVSAGEFGYNTIDFGGPKHHSGLLGVVEAYAAGPYLVKMYIESGGKMPDPSPAKIYNSRERIARKSIDESLEMFSVGLASLVNVLDPELIILGGGLSNMPVYGRLNRLTKKYTRKEMRKYVKIVKNKLGDSAGVYGAAALVFHNKGSD